MKNELTIREAVNQGKILLEHSGNLEAEHESWLLFSGVFQMNRTAYYVHGHELVEESLYEVYRERILRRCQGEPLQYIEGVAYFMGHEFKVSEAVLIPRFDTEILVTEALKYAKPGMRILDMCTGSGCIGISIALAVEAQVVAVDQSQDALLVAKSNQEALKARQVQLIQSDMFQQVDGKYQMIVSNPPYIRSGDIETLSEEVRTREPYMALDGHEDGLFFYKILAKESGTYLDSGCPLMMEIGYDQAEDVIKLLEENSFADIKVIKDLAGHDRVVCGWRI